MLETLNFKKKNIKDQTLLAKLISLFLCNHKVLSEFILEQTNNRILK